MSLYPSGCNGTPDDDVPDWIDLGLQYLEHHKSKPEWYIINGLLEYLAELGEFVRDDRQKKKN